MISRGAMGAAALLLLSSCGATSQSSSVPRNPLESRDIQVPIRSATSAPAGTPSTVKPTIERVPTEGAVGAVITDGTWIGWATGDPTGVSSPDIYRWKPGAADIQLVFKNPKRDRGVQLPAMHGDRLAFSESGPDGDGFINWNFLYLEKPGALPVKLASARRPINSPGLLPQPAISEDYLVYALQTIDGASATSQLIAVDLRTLKQTVIAKSDFDKIEYWYPSLDGDRLVYGTVEYASDSVDGERHVYLLDIGDPDASPRQLDGDGEASQPAIGHDTVIWKAAPKAYNANNWGQLERYSLSTGEVHRLDFMHEQTGYFLAVPNIGPRFLTAEPSNWSRLAVYDLETNQEVTVEQADPTGQTGYMRPSLAGNLFAWVAATDFTGVHSEIHYVRLPPPS